MRMDAERKKLRSLESQYNSTRLAVSSSDASDKDMIQLEQQLHHIQEQLEYQRKMYEEMEFQHLEVSKDTGLGKSPPPITEGWRFR